MKMDQTIDDNTMFSKYRDEARIKRKHEIAAELSAHRKPTSLHAEIEFRDDVRDQPPASPSPEVTHSRLLKRKSEESATYEVQYNTMLNKRPCQRLPKYAVETTASDLESALTLASLAAGPPSIKPQQTVQLQRYIPQMIPEFPRSSRYYYLPEAHHSRYRMNEVKSRHIFPNWTSTSSNHRMRSHMRTYLNVPEVNRAAWTTKPDIQADVWICDYCQVAKFKSYEGACAHEELCKAAKVQVSDLTIRQPGNNIDKVSEDTRDRDDASTTTDATFKTENIKCDEKSNENEYFNGCTRLSLPSVDSEWLTPLNCFIRSDCIEAFAATEDDVMSPSKRGAIPVGHIGIRCVFCSSDPVKAREIAAVSYPVSICGVYESVKRWYRVHLPLCCKVSDEMRNKIKNLANAANNIPTSRHYWTESAKAIGMVDTDQGVRFERDPSDPSSHNLAIKYITKTRFSTPQIQALVVDHEEDENEVDNRYIIFPEDQEYIPPYVYYLFRQMQRCKFTEADQFFSRSKNTKGFSGFECRYCEGFAGMGRYFPTSSRGLSTNSTSQNMYAHLMKCRKCPASVKDELNSLKADKGSWKRREFNWRQTFFDKIWIRLHDTAESDKM